jgi:dTDP-4-dehydrorhamnose reductase
MRITKDSRIYLAGCGGMLGEAFHARLAPIAQVKATDIDVNEPWLSHADVRDQREISKSIKDFNPDLIINLAALTDMEYCEKEFESAWLTNALGAENVGLIASELDATYVYISTAGIFDGKQDYYTDFDSPNPLSIYAKSKYYGERFAIEQVRKHYVVRAGWMMGGGPKKDKKFINKIYKQIANGSSILHVVNDKSGTPTYTVDFAAGVQRLVESDMYGVYNQVCSGPATRYDVAVEFVRLLGLEQKVKVNEVSSDFFIQEYFAPRPASEMLINMKLTARGLNVMRDWRECLREYSQTFVKHLQEQSAQPLTLGGPVTTNTRARVEQ